MKYLNEWEFVLNKFNKYGRHDKLYFLLNSSNVKL